MGCSEILSSLIKTFNLGTLTNRSLCSLLFCLLYYVKRLSSLTIGTCIINKIGNKSSQCSGSKTYEILFKSGIELVSSSLGCHNGCSHGNKSFYNLGYGGIDTIEHKVADE